MNWILFFLIAKGDGLTSGTLAFNQKSDCEAAMVTITKEFSATFTKVKAVCLKRQP